jgi:hypothetical protein
MSSYNVFKEWAPIAKVIGVVSCPECDMPLTLVTRLRLLEQESEVGRTSIHLLSNCFACGLNGNATLDVSNELLHFDELGAEREFVRGIMSGVVRSEWPSDKVRRLRQKAETLQ